MSEFSEIFEKVQEEVKYPFGIFVKKLGTDTVVESCYCTEQEEAIEIGKKFTEHIDDTRYVEVRERKGDLFDHEESPVWTCSMELKEEEAEPTKEKPAEEAPVETPTAPTKNPPPPGPSFEEPEIQPSPPEPPPAAEPPTEGKVPVDQDPEAVKIKKLEE